MSSLYASIPLSKERKEIRVILLHPGAFNDDIKCTISVVSLLENPEYEALSYVWGDATKTAPISVNDHDHNVTINLAKALRYLREGIRAPRVLWIDALSINQSSNEEKAWQVAMMSSIYASCTTANVWLGPEMDGGDLAHAGWFSLTRMYPGIDIVMQQTLGLIYELAQNNHLDDIYLLDFRDGEWDPCDDDPSLALQGLNVLLHRPWWERVWVIQEVVMPAKVIVTAGYLQLEWKDFTDAAQNFGRHSATCCRDVHTRMKGYDLGYLGNFYNVVDPIAILQMKRKAEDLLPVHVPDFMEVFYGYCDRRATLAQDKIFSLFGLLRESDSVIQNVPVDYSVDATDLCRLVTVALLQSGSSNVLLGDQSLKSLADLPSWVKDFTMTLRNEQKFKERNRNTQYRLFPPFQATDAKPGEAKDSSPKFLKDNILGLKGIHVDTIKTVVGEPYPDNLVLDTSFIWPWLIKLEDVAEESPEDYIKVNDGQNMKEAFWRTMLGEHIMSKPPMPTPVKSQSPSSTPSTTSNEEVSAVAEGLAKIAVDDETTKPKDGMEEDPGFASMQRLEQPHLYEMVEWLPTMWQSPKYSNLNGLEHAMLTTVLGRSFVIAEKGHFGLTPKEVQVGDEIWVLEGGRLPFILRKESGENEGPRRLVGDCFIHGILDGQVKVEEGQTWREVLLR